jgi:DNA-binding Lrp family transcriptional regulator
MIEEELDILNIVAQNPITSQRKIAEQTGVSLGQVNFLLKKFAKKGLIKIEGQTTKSLQYNLTPKGIAEKTEKTLNYIKTSYSVVQDLTARLRELGTHYHEKGLVIYLVGSKDEMMTLCEMALREVKAEYHIGAPDNRDPAESVIFYWQTDQVEQFGQNLCVNILD